MDKHNSEMLPNTTAVTVEGYLSIHQGSTETIGSLSGTGTVAFAGGANNLLVVGQDDTDTLFSGTIIDAPGANSGSGGLAKIGTGTLTLTGNNGYSEGTTINGGTLLANNTTGSATGSGPAEVNLGGTLGGTGSVAGPVTVTGGTVAPGESVGILTVNGVSYDSSSTFAVELAGSGGVAGTDFDQLVVTGNTTLDGTLDVSLLSPFTLGGEQSFEIIDVGGSLSGTFSGLAEGGLVGDYGGVDLFITYAAGDGNDIALFTTSGRLMGDANLDGFVDDDDLSLLLANWGGNTDWGHGEFSGVDPVDDDDLSLLLANWTGPAPTGTTVPEPTSPALLMLGALAILRPSRRW